MRYIGTRLKEYLKSERGGYTDLAERMQKYRKPRTNGGNAEYSLAPFLRDGHNITIASLTALMKETGFPLDFFVDFEPSELPRSEQPQGIIGSNNIVNSSLSNDLTLRLDHLNEVLRMKDEMLTDKERIIALKDSEIAQWKKRYDDLIRLTQCEDSDKNRT